MKIWSLAQYAPEFQVGMDIGFTPWTTPKTLDEQEEREAVTNLISGLIGGNNGND
jgi:hypothetical protein